MRAVRIVPIMELAKHLGQVVEVKGELAHRASFGKIHFLSLIDGSARIKIEIAAKNVPKEIFRATGKLRPGNPISVTGLVTTDPVGTLMISVGELVPVRPAPAVQVRQPIVGRYDLRLKRMVPIKKRKNKQATPDER